MASTLVFLLSLLLLPLPSFSQSCTSQTFSNNRLFATCNNLPHLSAALHWTYDTGNSTLSIAFVAPPSRPGGWVAWALNPTGSGMVGAQAVVGLRQSSGGSLVAKTFNISAYGPVTPSRIAFETWGLEAEEDAGGLMTLFATVKLPRGVAKMNQAWQVGPSSTGGIPDKHDFGMGNLNAKGTLDVVSGQSSGGTDSRLKEKNIHGILNTVSWGILLPIGAIIARYLKAFKSLDSAWFYLHVLCQLTGYALGVTGWAIGLNLGKKSKGVQYTTHRNLGIALFSLATLQITALFLRPKKDHKYRVYWNRYHQIVGMAVVILGIINVFRGLEILSPARKWKDAYIVVLCVLGVITLMLEVTTCFIARRRKLDSSDSTKKYNGSGAAKDQRGFQQPLSA